jgi:hypothetical protein
MYVELVGVSKSLRYSEFMKGWNVVKRMCPTNCGGRDEHVHRVSTAEEVQMPPEIWDQHKSDSAYRCSYCDAVWFEKSHSFSVIVGLYKGLEFQKFSEPRTVYMQRKKKR